MWNTEALLKAQTDHSASLRSEVEGFQPRLGKKRLTSSCWWSFVWNDVQFLSWLSGRLGSLNTNQQAGHELVFITLSPLYDSQPWLCNQLPDFSFCCAATDSEQLWLRRSIRDQAEESRCDGWDQQSPSEPSSNTCILSITHTQHTFADI